MQNTKGTIGKEKKRSRMDKDIAEVNIMNRKVDRVDGAMPDKGRNRENREESKARNMKEIEDRKQVAEKNADVNRHAMNTGNDIVDKG